jgi:hypothetical protein
MKTFFSDNLLANIPEDLLEVPHRVESITGIRMSAREPDASIEKELGYMAAAPAVMDINPAADSITLWARRNSITAHMIAHELMHLRHQVVEQQVKLLPHPCCGSTASVFIRGLDVELEHLLIVPEEIRRFPEAKTWWNTHCEQRLSRIRGDRRALLLRWMFVSTVLPDNEKLLGMCASYLTEFKGEDMLGYAQRLAIDVQDAMPDKISMITAAMNRFSPQLRDQALVGRYGMEDDRLVIVAV